jgi:hypothetical protein
MKKCVNIPAIPPRWYQLPFCKNFDTGSQFNILSWPRRAGKDVITFSQTVSRAMKVPGNYYYLFPTRAWAQRALWDNICEWAGGKRLVDIICPPEIVKGNKNNTELYIDLINGSRIKLGGTDNLDFVGQGGSGYALSEYSLHKEAVTSFLMPILDEGNAWLIANGTMRGKQNPLYKLWEKNQARDKWYTQWYTLADTKTNYWINREEGIEINTELIGRINPENNRPFVNVQDYVDSGAISFVKAKQEFLNLADGEVEGGYYGYEIKKLRSDGRYKSIDPFSDHVYTFWDLGGVKQDSDKTCILFAHIDLSGRVIRVVDYYENTGFKRGHYFEVLRQKGYTYAGHYFPHDAKRSNEWTGENMAETARREYGIEIRFVPKTQNVLNDIEICRRSFAMTEINSDLCDPLMEHVSKYHEKSSTGKPCHQNNCDECNGASHGADAFRCLQMAFNLKLIEPYMIDVNAHFYGDDDYDDDWMLV